MAVDVNDVETILGRALTDGEDSRVDRLIVLAEGLVESALPGFSVATGTETATVAPTDPAVLWTPRYPLTAVTSIAVNGAAVTGYTFDQKGKITLASWPWPDRIDLDPILTSSVTVDYGYGLVPLPDDVTLTVAAMVASVLRQQAANPAGSQSISIDGFSESFGDAAARAAVAGMTFPEGALARWKRNRQFSVPLVGR